jgi:hypothetical protein
MVWADAANHHDLKRKCDVSGGTEAKMRGAKVS